MALREVIVIDEEKCDGCGLCVPACAEGAIQIIDDVAKLVSETYCDGLGACLGECPQDAITMEKREAAEFDEKAVQGHLEKIQHEQKSAPIEKPPVEAAAFPACPGSLSRSLKPEQESNSGVNASGVDIPSQLANWPVQLNLVPVKAPYFDGARLLIAADCVPFAHADFHRNFLAGRTLIIGCPKLDDINHYQTKLVQMFQQNDINEVEVAFMEVPCCFGLVQVVQTALEESGKDIPLILTRVGIKGAIEQRNNVKAS